MVQGSMHAILATVGTDGDVLPFLGLGLELRRRGHRITLVAAGNYAELAAAHGIEFRELVSAKLMAELLGHPDFWHPIRTARFTAKWGASLIEPQYRLIDAMVAEGSGDAVLIGNPAVFGASITAETRGRPLCHLILQPWMIHSAMAPALMPLVSLPRWAPRFMHSLFYHAIDLAADFLFGPELNRVRRSAGLKPMRRILHHWLAPELVIGMFPEWYGPPQKDWPKQVRLAGFPRFDGATDLAPPAGLPEFLKREKPTVVFTFGSGMMHARELFEVSARVCAAIGCQGIFLNRHFKPASLPAHMFLADFIPFREIFPRCAAVVHHGGIGTTAEALAAGTPQLIMPLGFDQLDNGDRVRRFGVGLHTGPKHRLLTNAATARASDVAEVAAALQELLKPEMRERCRVFAKRLANENAIGTAAGWVEKLAER